MHSPSRQNDRGRRRIVRLLRRFGGLLALCATLVWSAGCDPVNRHKALSLIFDGVPAMPPAQEYCREYFASLESPEEQSTADETAADQQTDLSSKHEPYAEKRCDDCHAKNNPGGLIVGDARQLCVLCHDGFTQGNNVHGPVAIGACQACHLPHSSPNPSLLKESSGELCSSCHQERRLAQKMHDQVRQNRMICSDCHDPHSGDSRYFLR